MRNRRSITCSFLPCAFALLPIVGSAACGEEEAPAADDVVAEADDLAWIDTLALNPLGAGCVFSNSGLTSGTATVTLANGGETALFTRRSIDSAILANGSPCQTAAPFVVATATSLKKLNITGGTGNDVIIIDFINGTFGAGAAGGAGIVIDMSQTGNDDFKLRGLTTADNITVGEGVAGARAINFGADAFKDITVLGGGGGAETLAIATGGGNDVVSAAGNTSTGAALLVSVSINGGDGDDTLTGGDSVGGGADNISGGAGNDTIRGGLGNDQLNGGPGSDTFDEGSVPNGSDTFNGGSDVLPAVGVDTVSYASRLATGLAITVTLGSGNGNDGEGGATEGDTVGPLGDIEAVTGGPLADNLTCGQATGCTLSGGAGNDTLVGNSGNDTINGGAGNDTITGAGGADVLNGDGDDDFFLELTDPGAPGDSDTFNGGTGFDTVDYSQRTGAMTVTMGDQAGNDGLNTGELDNVKNDVERLLSGSGNDTITGNDLANTINGGQGTDVISGGNGDDLFTTTTGPDGNDTFNGGAGIDTVDYSTRTGRIRVTMDGLAANDGDDPDGIAQAGPGAGTEGDDIKNDVENLNGSTVAGDDITGNSSSNFLDSGSGTDTLNGGGGAGSDICLGGSGSGDTTIQDTGCDL